MVFSCGKSIYLLIPFALSLGTLLLTIISFVGSTKNNSQLTDIYLLRINISDIDYSKVLTSTDSTLSSLISSSSDSSTLVNELGSTVASQLGLSDIYSACLWNYCKGNLNTDNSINYTYCGKPKFFYYFNPVEILEDDIDNSTLASTLTDLTGSDISVSSIMNDLGINLPDNIESYMHTLKIVMRVIFICYIIGIVLTAISLILGIMAACSNAVNVFVAMIVFLATIALVIAMAGSTGVYIYIRNVFNDNASDYGITADISRKYLGLAWGAVGGSILALFFWTLGICCCCCGRRRRSDSDEERKPFIGYAYR